MGEVKQENMLINWAEDEKEIACEQQHSKQTPFNVRVKLLRITLLMAALCVMIAPFLTYASLGFLGFEQSFSLFNNESSTAGIYMILSGIIPLLLALFWPKRILVLIFSVIPVLLFFVIKIKIDSYLGIMKEALTPAIGYYLLLIAAIVLAVSGISFFIITQNACQSKSVSTIK